MNLGTVERALARRAAASSDYDLNPDAVPAAPRVLRDASVLVPLVERGAGLAMILTRRATRLKHHPGQIAFPGGKRDPGDTSALATALREADEEIGLAASEVRVLGTLGPHETVTRFTVTPFVGQVRPDFLAHPDRSEVDEIFEVPLTFVLDRANMHVHRRRWGGGWRSYYAIPYGPHYIWGATARILKSLADRMHDP